MQPTIDFSLFFFSTYKVESENKYRLVMEASKFADENDFQAVWTPERHFHEFGGLFPNPALTSTALAMITSRVELRCGSIVSPLHDVIRIAEDWSVVDNLSGGRVALSFASGWNGDDFVLAPDNYSDRHRVMHDQIQLVRKLWNGDPIKRKNGLGEEIEVRIFPTPIQKELPIWITAAGNEKTYSLAGEMGVNVLTHLLGQSMDDLARKIELYRKGRERGGYSAASGKVALMLHTYLGDSMEEVSDLVEKPFTDYLRSATDLSKNLYKEAGLDPADIPEEDRELMLKHSFKRYFKTSGLFGTVESCSEMVSDIKEIGVNEIACLVDFGIEPNVVMEGLNNLRQLKELFAFTDKKIIADNAF